MNVTARPERIQSASAGSAPAAITVLVIDPSDFSRACTVAGLGATGDFVIQSCASVAQCEGDLAPDVILFQSAEPSADDRELYRQLALAAKCWPGTATLALVNRIDDDAMLGTIRAGASGILHASASLECLRSAIVLMVHAMGVYPPALAEYLRREAQPAKPSAASPSIFRTGQLDGLTNRQTDVLKLLAMGFSNKAIAQQLRISESTVKVHIRAIMALNGATNRTQIVAHFLKSNAHDD